MRLVPPRSFMSAAPPLLAVLSVVAFHSSAPASEGAGRSAVAAPGRGAASARAAREAVRPDAETGGIHAGLFSRPAEPEPPQAAPPRPAPAPEPVPVPPSPASTTPDPLDGLVYAGFADAGGQPRALLEDRKTREGWWLEPGDSFRGFTVRTVAREAVTLRQGEANRALALNDGYGVVPLDDPAPAASPNASYIAVLLDGVTLDSLATLSFSINDLPAVTLSHDFMPGDASTRTIIDRPSELPVLGMSFLSRPKSALPDNLETLELPDD